MEQKKRQKQTPEQIQRKIDLLKAKIELEKARKQYRRERRGR